MLTRFFTLTMLAAIAADSSSTSADARGGRSVPHVLVSIPQVLDLDKSGTTGGQEKKNGSQEPNTKGLASHVSFAAERTGFQIRNFATLFTTTLYDRKSNYGLGLSLLTCDRL